MPLDAKQLRDLSVDTVKLAAGIISATAAGRAKMAAGLFDLATANDKFAAGSVALTKLEEAVIQADGGQAFTAAQSMGNNKLTALATPTAATDAANKSYVDSVATGLDVKASVRLATAAALPAVTPAGVGIGHTLTATAVGILTVDGVATVLNDRILVKDQAAADDNGIYDVTTEGTVGVAFVLTRATDADTDAEVTAGLFTFVEAGTTNADSGWVLTTDNPIVVDTTALAFGQFSGAGSIAAGVGLTKTGNTIDVGATSIGLVLNANSVDVAYGLVGGLTSVDAGDAASAGVAALAARGDHQHAVNTGVPGAIQPDAAAAEGAATTLARSDHTHSIVAAAAADVGIANSEGAATSFSRSDHVHRSPKPATANKQMAASLTAADNAQGTATALTTTPALDGYVRVLVNGLGVQIGDGTKASVESYFSNDGGTTARAISAITAADTWHWNGSVAGYELETSDIVDFDYQVF